MTKIFKTPFAAQGDRTDVPVEAQSDGSVSFTQGYGYDYERDQATDPAAKDIEREKMNALFHDVTEAMGEVQSFGAAVWSDAGKPYAIRSLVYFSNRTWQSRVANNNTQPGTGNDWIELKADANPVDMLYPVGIVTWFAQNKNPNTLFPGTTWKYIGENRTVRLAAETGADVMTTGGSDSVTLALANLPAHGHTFSASTNAFDYGTKTSSSFDYGTKTSSSFDYGNKTTGAFDYGTKTTNSAGAHTHDLLTDRNDSRDYHNRGSNFGHVGSGYQPVVNSGSGWISSGGAHSHTVAIGAHSHTIGIGAHSHTTGIGAHSHTVGIGAHSHTVSGTTANSGSGSAVTVTNAFIKLMGWYRSA